MALVEDQYPNQIQPFLKWAGGKRWLVQSEVELSPPQHNRYLEPFVGGGAVFFTLSPEEFIIADLNEELILCYETIRSNWRGVVNELKRHQEKHSKEYYYQVRDTAVESEIQTAARLIYLNRTCWNGLYRVNLKGKFNVPKGTKRKVVFETDDFETVAERLSLGAVKCQDFEATLNQAQEGDFVFVDPPYTVAHNMNAFVKYNEKIFSWRDQVRLRDAIVRAMDRGATITATNADHESVIDLYDGLGVIESVSRYSAISGNNSGRGSTSELLMKFGWE